MLSSLSNAWGQSTDWLNIRGIVELQTFSNNNLSSWYSGGYGKLRYDDDTFPIQLGNAGLHVDLHLTDTPDAVTIYTPVLTGEFTENNNDKGGLLRFIPRHLRLR
jgi:hypothetical protein